jgi:hypothetical protein
MTYLNLTRAVARTSAKCAWCSWLVQEYDCQYDKVIDGTSLGRYCSERCAGKSTVIELRTVYG